MSTARLLDAVRAAGLRLSVDGTDLRLEAAQRPPDELLRDLKRLKGEILAFLRETPAPIDEDRVVRWLDAHGEASEAGRCAWCGQAETPNSVVVPFGTRNHTWLHPECWPAWRSKQRERAKTALRGAGILPARTQEHADD
jgi:hypothetical protein